MTKLNLDQQVIVVTGAGGGLGKAYATYLAANGARVLVNNRVRPDAPKGPTSAERTVHEIRSAGGEAEVSNVDVTDPDCGGLIVEQALQRWGRIDAVVNNAGSGASGPVESLTDEDVDAQLQVHFYGTLRVTRAVWSHMKANGYGRVVNTLSDSLLGVPFMLPYLAGKGAILGMTNALAQEGSLFGIKVNAVVPAAYTAMTAQIGDENLVEVIKDNFTAEQVAPTVAWMCHPDLDFTGQAVMSGGGRLARLTLATTEGAMTNDLDIATARDSLRDVLDGELTAPPSCADAVMSMMQDVMGGLDAFKLV